MVERFDNKQERLIVCGTGRVLIRINEREVIEERSKQVGLDEYVTEEVTVYEYDCDDVYVNSPSESNILAALKEKYTKSIIEFDSSDAVNAFLLNGKKAWLDKATRVGLVNSVNVQKNMGQANTTLWLGTKSYTLPVDTALMLLMQLENYASICYNKTAEHMAGIEAAQSIEEVVNYDYKVGYPEMIVVNV